MSEPFVKVPHWVQDYLMSADLNITQFKIVNTVVRYSFGYNNKWCYIALSRMADYTQCNKRQVTRELKTLLEEGVLIERQHEGNRELAINPVLKSLRDRNVTHNVTHASDSTDTNASDYRDTSASDSTDTHIKKEKESIKKDNNNTSILTNTMVGYKHYLYEFGYERDITVDDVLDIFYDRYEHYKKEEHPRLTEEQLQRIYSVIRDMDSQYLAFYDDDSSTAIIDEFFTTVHSNDHRLNHFATEGIIGILQERYK